jgi:hypothetical protein
MFLVLKAVCVLEWSLRSELITITVEKRPSSVLSCSVAVSCEDCGGSFVPFACRSVAQRFAGCYEDQSLTLFSRASLSLVRWMQTTSSYPVSSRSNFSLPSLFWRRRKKNAYEISLMSVCLYVYPPIVARQTLSSSNEYTCNSRRIVVRLVFCAVRILFKAK